MLFFICWIKIQILITNLRNLEFFMESGILFVTIFHPNTFLPDFHHKTSPQHPMNRHIKKSRIVLNSFLDIFHLSLSHNIVSLNKFPFEALLHNTDEKLPICTCIFPIRNPDIIVFNFFPVLLRGIFVHTNSIL